MWEGQKDRGTEGWNDLAMLRHSSETADAGEGGNAVESRAGGGRGGQVDDIRKTGQRCIRTTAQCFLVVCCCCRGGGGGGGVVSV